MFRRSMYVVGAHAVPPALLSILLATACGGGSTQHKDDDAGTESEGEASARTPDGASRTPDGTAMKDGCTPRVCKDIDEDCGSVDDGCGGTLECGTCTAPATCGGSGTPNVCGVPCPEECPAGMTCTPSGTCESAPDTLSVTVDVAKVAVAGTVTRNGERDGSVRCGQVIFTEVTRGSTVTQSILCPFSDVGWDFEAMLYPGTYSVSVRGSTSGGWKYLGPAPVLPDRIVVKDTPLSDITLDVVEVDVSGNITLSGSPLKKYCSDSDPTELVWTDAERGRDFTFTVDCDMDNGWSYSGTVFPGTYRIELHTASLDSGELTLNEALTVEAGSRSRTEDFNLRFGSIAGVLHPGSLTAAQCAGSSVKLNDESTHAKYSIPVQCTDDADWSFDLDEVQAGTYQVVFKGPLGSVQLIPALQVKDKPVPLALDAPQIVSLSATVKLNGAFATLNEPYASLDFYEHATQDGLGASPDCSTDPCTFKFEIYTGTYDVEYHDLVDKELFFLLRRRGLVTLQESDDELLLDFDGVNLTGHVTRNDETVIGVNCTDSIGSTYYTSYIQLTDIDRGLVSKSRIQCDSSKGWLFDAVMVPGTYRAIIDADFSRTPFFGLPDQSTADLVVERGTTEYTVNFPGDVDVTGEVTRNGESITGTTSCGGASLRFEDTKRGWSRDVPLTCDASGWHFSAALVQGTYQVKVLTAYDKLQPILDPELPAMTYAIATDLALNEDDSDLKVDAATRYVTVRLTRDGQSLDDKSCSNLTFPGSKEFERSYVRFTSLTTGEVLERAIRCTDGDWINTSRLFADTYRVTVVPGSKSALAPGDILVKEKLEVP